MPEQTLPQSRMTAGQLLAHLLELITASTTIRDVTPRRIRAALGIELEKQPGGGFSANARLTTNWWYSLWLVPDFFLGPRLSFTLIDNDGGHSGPMTDVCSSDVDQFGAALQAAGFDRIPMYGEHGRRLGYLFQRTGLRVETLIRDASGEPDAECCVWSVQVS